MNTLKRIFLVLLVMCALFADVLSKITPIVMIGTIGVSFIYFIKNNIKIKKNKYYIIIFINILFILLTSVVHFSATNVKYILYLISMLLIMEIMDDKDIKLILNCVYICSIVLSVYILIIGYQVNSIGNLANVRNYILFQKQSINVIFSVIIPYSILLCIDKKKTKYFIILMLFIFSSIFIMQVKSLIITLPLAFFVYQFLNRKINISTIFKYGVLGLVLIYVLYTFNLLPQLTPIIDYLIYGDKSIYIGNKYLDTLILRKEIFVFCFQILSTALFLGIGYGNYYKYVVGKMYYVSSRGIFQEYPTVTENGVVTFLVEGGVLGFISHMSLIVFTIADLKKVIVSNKKIEIYEKAIILSFLSIVISNFMQDNLNFTYWILIGISMNIIRRYKGKIIC